MIHTQLKSTVYEVLASVLSLGQGECRWGQAPPSPSPAFLTLSQRSPPLTFSRLYPRIPSGIFAHSWLNVPQGSFRYNYRD